MASDLERVRELLGEQIPAGGSETDTMFTNARLLDILATTGDIESATAEGWRIKAAEYADLVDTSEGTSKRAMSDLHQHALRMADSYVASVTRRTGTRTRPIVRP